MTSDELANLVAIVRGPLRTAASYVDDHALTLGLKLHAESCVAALPALDAIIAEIVGLKTEIERIGRAQDRAEANERASHAENIELRAQVEQDRLAFIETCDRGT